MNGALQVVQSERCWASIGVWGNQSCPELPRVVHCRNCASYTAGAEELLSREAPADYLEMWARFLGQDKDSGPAMGQPHVIFRVGRSWLALRASVLREITAPSVIRSLPHRRSELLLGLTAVRGEIYLCASLHLLIGEALLEDPGVPRFLVIGHETGSWIFPVDDVSGIEELPEDRIEPLPATLANTGGVYTRGIAKTSDRPVGVMDEELMFRALERKIP